MTTILGCKCYRATETLILQLALVLAAVQRDPIQIQ